MTTILFAPGAGAPSSSAWMQAWTRRLEALAPVITLDYAYQLVGRKSPDPQAKLIATHREALSAIKDTPRILAGKSMGSRVGCHVSLEDRVEALVCFGYPLRGQNGKLRDVVLRQLTTPILFIAGTRDALCPLNELADVRKQMSAPNALHVVEGGDHSLVLPKSAAKKSPNAQADADAAILDAIRAFLVSCGISPQR